MAFNPAFADAISSVESGGRYGLLGPVTRSGDRAYGKYQVMGSNIPQWTKEILGQPMTPQQFLANPQAQDAVFAGKFGQYLNKYGNPQDAASVWFSGRPLSKAANSSDGYITSSQYVNRFNKALGQPAPTQVASAAPQSLAPSPAPQQPAANPIQSAPASPLPALASAPPNLAALSGLSGLFDQQQKMQPAPIPKPPPINMPLRRPPDLSGLAQLLQTAPAPLRGLIFGA